jgi:PAS domain S-box-containing protein
MNRLKSTTFKFWQKETTDFSEIEGLLDLVPGALVIVDQKNGLITHANSRAIRYTAYTRVELIQRPITALIPGFFSAQVEADRNTNHDMVTASFQLHNGVIENFAIQGNYLDRDHRWLAILFEPLATIRKRQQEQLRVKKHMDALIALSHSLQHGDTDGILTATLETAHVVTGAESLILYQVDQSEPHLSRVSHIGEMLNMPETLPVSEVGKVYRPEVWSHGKRIRNGLQRIARTNQLAYLATTGIGDEHALLGMLVAADRSGVPDSNLSTILQVLANILANIFQQTVMLDHLQQARSRQEEQLLALEIVQENTQDGIVLLSPDMRISILNPAAEQTLGYAQSEIVGFPVDSVIIGPDNMDAMLNFALEGISTPNLGNVSIHRRDGSAFPAHMEIHPVMNKGKLINIAMFIRDLSEHENYRIKIQQLEQRAVLGEFTAIIAHEVRNPVNNISMTLQLMEKNLTEDNSNREFVDRMKQDCDRLSHLMDSVLSFSRSNDYRLEPMELEPFIQRQLQRWSPRMARCNVKSHLQYMPSTPKILGNEKPLEQVFNNLFNNALRAMNETGGDLSIKVYPERINENQIFVRIDVSDTGFGIPPENLERVFNPFYSTDPQGTGLGLSIVQRIITAHKGTISADSFPGGGTVFMIRIPATAVA